MIEYSLKGDSISYQYSDSFLVHHARELFGIRITTVEVEIAAYLLTVFFGLYLVAIGCRQLLQRLRVYTNISKSKQHAT